MNILKTMLLIFGISFLVSACADDTDSQDTVSNMDLNPTLEAPYIGDNDTQNYEYMKELVNLDNYTKGTQEHPFLKTYFGITKQAQAPFGTGQDGTNNTPYYGGVHNSWYDWTQTDHHHDHAEDNIQILPDENGTNPTKNAVIFPHTYHQDIARYTDLIGNCTTNCHTRYIYKDTRPFQVAPIWGPNDKAKSKIVFSKKIQVGDSSYNNSAHNFCWSCHANLPKPSRAPHGLIVTKDGTTHQPNKNCTSCHKLGFGDLTESLAGGDGTKADQNTYEPQRENYFGNKAQLPPIN